MFNGKENIDSRFSVIHGLLSIFLPIFPDFLSHKDKIKNACEMNTKLNEWGTLGNIEVTTKIRIITVSRPFDKGI